MRPTGTIIFRVQHVVVVAEPWDRPSALERAWVVYKVALARYQSERTQLDFALSPDEARRFTAAIDAERRACEDAVRAFDMLNAQAAVAEDRTEMLNVLRHLSWRSRLPPRTKPARRTPPPLVALRRPRAEEEVLRAAEDNFAALNERVANARLRGLAGFSWVQAHCQSVHRGGTRRANGWRRGASVSVVGHPRPALGPGCVPRLRFVWVQSSYICMGQYRDCQTGHVFLAALWERVRRSGSRGLQEAGRIDPAPRSVESTCYARGPEERARALPMATG